MAEIKKYVGIMIVPISPASELNHEIIKSIIEMTDFVVTTSSNNELTAAY